MNLRSEDAVVPVGARGRGRPPVITREQVVDAATRIGLQHLTVQAVADELGVTRAAIYHYVDGVDDLRRLAAYETVPRFAVLRGDHQSWHDWVRAFARACRAWRLEQGDVLLQVTVDPAQLDWFLVIVDEGIDVLVRAGFSEVGAGHALHFVGGVVWINTQDEIIARSSPDGRHPQASEVARTVADQDHELSHVRRNVTGVAFADPDARFERELRWVIDALEVELARST